MRLDELRRLSVQPSSHGDGMASLSFPCREDKIPKIGEVIEVGISARQKIRGTVQSVHIYPNYEIPPSRFLNRKFVDLEIDLIGVDNVI